MSLKENSECYALCVIYIYKWWIVWNGDKKIYLQEKRYLCWDCLGCSLFVDLINKDVS